MASLVLQSTCPWSSPLRPSAVSGAVLLRRSCASCPGATQTLFLTAAAIKAEVLSNYPKSFTNKLSIDVLLFRNNLYEQKESQLSNVHSAYFALACQITQLRGISASAGRGWTNMYKINRTGGRSGYASCNEYCGCMMAESRNNSKRVGIKRQLKEANASSNWAVYPQTPE